MKEKNFLEDIFILEGLRTPVGRTFRGLKDLTAPQLACVVIKELLSQKKINLKEVNEVVLGNTVSAGAGQNLARQAVCLSGLPVTVPAYTVNCVCASGLQAVILSAQSIACGQAALSFAGGTESASHSPYIIRKDDKTQQQTDSLIQDGLWCQMTDLHMGDLAEHLAQEFQITRERQDQYALESHLKACGARRASKFSGEIVPVKGEDGSIFDRDERPRENISLERLRALPSVFKEQGSVTAGNSPSPSDGAAVLAVASAQLVKKNKWKPKARILSFSFTAGEPKEVFTAAVPSVRECLKKAKLTVKDVDLFEISEAFAVQAIYTRDRLKIPGDKMNIYGGDIALGHPLGAAGARALVTLLHALANEKKKIGLVSVCLGGGGAVSLAVENLA